MDWKKMRRSLLRRLGFVKSASPYQFNTAFDAQKHFIQKSDPLIFDVGAYTGQTVEQYRSLFPGGTIYSFEPFPASFHELLKRYGNDRNVHLEQLGLLDIEGIISFYANKSSATNSFLAPGSDDTIELQEKISVTSKTLDGFCEEEGIDHLDILKMDAQGAESRVLKGAEMLLKEKRIGMIYTEVLFIPLYEEQAYFHDITKQLQDIGYFLFDVYHPRYSQSGQLKWADALYLSSLK